MAKTIKQISVFSENKPGKLFKIAETLGKANVNIRALMIAESGDFGIVRLIVDRPEDAYDALRNVGFTVSETDVIGIRMDDQPGGLLKIADVLASKNINMDYAYAFVTPGSASNAALVIRVSDTDAAVSALESSGIELFEEGYFKKQ